MEFNLDNGDKNIKMKKHLFVGVGLVIGFIVIAITFLLHGPPKYVRNWPLVKSGMSKKEVLELLGSPTAKAGPTKVTMQADGDSEVSIAVSAGIAFAFMGSPHEYWEYSPIVPEKENLLDFLFGPSDESFVVYFDANGTVLSCRAPLSGHYAEPHSE